MALRKQLPKTTNESTLQKTNETDTASLENRISQLERALGPDSIADTRVPAAETIGLK